MSNNPAPTGAGFFRRGRDFSLPLFFFAKKNGQVALISGKVNSANGVSIFMEMEVCVWTGTVYCFV